MGYDATAQVFAGVALCVITMAPVGAAGGPACDAIITPPGAVYLSSDDPANAIFNGNSFLIDGNDGRLDGSAGTAPAVFGVATRTEANAQEVRDSLAATQRDNVIGRGYSPGPPIQPSVAATAGPSDAEISQLVADLLARPGTVTSGAATLNGNVTLGTQAAPQVTHLTGQGSGVTVSGNGNVSGAGVVIVEDALTVRGTLQFAGLVIVRGPVDLSATTGYAIVSGSLWTPSVALAVGSSFMGRYSSDGLALAGSLATAVCPVCGDGTIDPGEECDDGNDADGDCCSSACGLEPSGMPCDDGDACTVNDVCAQGACTGTTLDCGDCSACDHMTGCVAAAADGCRQPLVPSRSRLVFRDASDQVSWTWRTGQATTLADFGDPRALDDYALCVFGGEARSTVLVRATAPAGGVCSGRPCWMPIGDKRFRYRDSFARGGLRSIGLTAGSDGRARIKLAGDGVNLDASPLPFTLPLTVQLRAGNGTCWETYYPAANVTQDAQGLVGRGASPD